VTVQLAVSMRAHGRGGLMLIVPGGTDAWRESMVQPMTYSVSPAFSELAVLAQGPAPGGSARAWREELSRVVDAIAGLTAMWHAPPRGRAVRLRPARRARARGIAGRPLHRVRVLAV
jgi:hypothetical protein